MGFGLQGLRFGIQGSGFEAWLFGVSGFRDSGVHGAVEAELLSEGFRVSSPGFRVY